MCVCVCVCVCVRARVCLCVCVCVCVCEGVWSWARISSQDNHTYIMTMIQPQKSRTKRIFHKGFLRAEEHYQALLLLRK